MSKHKIDNSDKNITIRLPAISKWEEITIINNGDAIITIMPPEKENTAEDSV